MIIPTWGAVFLILAAVLISQYVVGKIVSSLYSRILGTAKQIKDKYRNNEKIENEITALEAIEDKKERLGFITRIVGITEFLGFASLVGILMLLHGSSFLAVGEDLLKVVIAWLGLKTLGSYQQWAGSIFGRAAFYVFLIGSILNIGAAILFGVLILKTF